MSRERIVEESPFLSHLVHLRRILGPDEARAYLEIAAEFLGVEEPARTDRVLIHGRTLQDVIDLAYREALAESPSFAAAARRLGVDPKTIYNARTKGSRDGEATRARNRRSPGPGWLLDAGPGQGGA